MYCSSLLRCRWGWRWVTADTVPQQINKWSSKNTCTVSCWQYHSSRQVTWEGAALQSRLSSMYVPQQQQQLFGFLLDPNAMLTFEKCPQRAIRFTAPGSHREGDEMTSNTSRKRHRGEVLPACSGAPCNPRLALGRATGSWGAWFMPKRSPCGCWGLGGGRSGHTQHSWQTIPMGTAAWLGWRRLLVYLMGMSAPRSPQHQWKALETPCCPPQAPNLFPGTSCSSVALPTPQKLAASGAKADPVIMAVGKASEITSLAWIVSQVNLSSA